MFGCKPAAALLWLTLLFAAAHLSVAGRDERKDAVTGRAIVLQQDFPGQPSKKILLVDQKKQRTHVVVETTDEDIQGLVTGVKVKVSGNWLSRGDSGLRAASSQQPGAEAHYCFLGTRLKAWDFPKAVPVVTEESYVVEASGNASAAVAATPVAVSTNALVAADISTLFIPLVGLTRNGTACPGTLPARLNVTELKKVVFAEANPTGVTVGSTFNKCSFGKSRLTARNSKLVNTVKLPCAGTTNGVPWTFAKCDVDDFYGWADAADAVLRSKGIALDKYKYRVYLVPPGSCGFVGLATVGCDGSTDCRAWIGGDYWGQPQAIVHELGHNLFLAHAGGFNEDGFRDEYADSTSAMGYCCANRCFNAPQAWQLGWISAQEFNGTSLRAGQTVRTVLTVQSATAQRSGIRISAASWAPGVDPIFLGLRSAVGGDTLLDSSIVSRVQVYSAGIAHTYDPKQTTWLASLGVGEQWVQPAAGLVVRVRAFNTVGALVSICRKAGAETVASCSAGVDNDCNGLAGRAEPACAGLLKPRRRG